MADMESVKRKIAPASREELYEIAAFLDDCWRSAYSGIVSSDFLNAMKTDERYKRLLARFDEQTSAFLVLRDEDVLIGVTVFGKSFTDDYLNDGEVSAIYVHPEYIGKGFGHQIMAQAEEALSAKGYDHFVLDVLSGNERAISFYKQQGYEIVAKRSITLGDKDYPLTVFRKKNTLKKGDVPRVILREWGTEDAPDLMAAINNKKVLNNLRDGIPYPYTEKDAAEFIAATLSAEKDSQYAFAICINDKVIGSIGVFRRDNVHRYTAEMGYYIAEPYWCKGIMTEAVRQMCDYIFENTDIIRIYAEPYAHNNASCRVLEKAGFQFEGLLRQNAVKNGKSVDMKMYAIISDRKKPVFQDIKARINEPEVGVIISYAALDGSPEGVAKEAETYLSSDKLNFYGWVEDGRVVGICGFEVHDEKVEIYLISVAEDRQKQGIGGAMVTALQKMYDLPLEAETVEEAVGFYRKRGFVTTAFPDPEWGEKFTCVLRPRACFTAEELIDAHRSLLSTMKKCVKVLESERLPQSQRTLTERRVSALKIALSLIEKEQEIT